LWVGLNGCGRANGAPRGIAGGAKAAPFMCACAENSGEGLG
jgi:hypothetical protein